MRTHRAKMMTQKDASIEVVAALGKADVTEPGIAIKDTPHRKNGHDGHASIKDLGKFRPL